MIKTTTMACMLSLALNAAPAAADDGLVVPPRHAVTPATASLQSRSVPRADPQIARRVRGAVLGIVGGMFVGAAVGAKMEQGLNRYAVDAPINGIVWGGLIGAVPGAVIGFKLAR